LKGSDFIYGSRFTHEDIEMKWIDRTGKLSHNKSHWIERLTGGGEGNRRSWTNRGTAGKEP